MSYGVSDMSEGKLKKMIGDKERERGFVDQSKELRIFIASFVGGSYDLSFLGVCIFGLI